MRSRVLSRVEESWTPVWQIIRRPEDYDALSTLINDRVVQVKLGKYITEVRLRPKTLHYGSKAFVKDNLTQILLDECKDYWVEAYTIVEKSRSAQRAVNELVELGIFEKRGGVAGRPVEIRRLV